MSFLLINKPEGWTSFDAVAFVRSHVKDLPGYTDNPDLQIKDKQKRIRVGHAGTLDPFATGLLIIGVGRESTRRLDEFKKMPKTYIAEIKLGQVSDTYDKTGKISDFDNQQKDFKKPKRKEMLSVLKTFIGKQNQTPPMFSAKKINGQRLYDLARKGIEVERKPSEIDINKIKLIKYTWPILKIEVQCSAGTYIRSLAHDIGQKLGTGAYCQELVRTQIGDYLLSNAINLDTLK